MSILLALTQSIYATIKTVRLLMTELGMAGWVCRHKSRPELATVNKKQWVGAPRLGAFWYIIDSARLTYHCIIVCSNVGELLYVDRK